MKKYPYFVIVIILILTVSTTCLTVNAEPTITDLKLGYENYRLTYSYNINTTVPTSNENTNESESENIGGSLFFDIFDLYRNEIKFVDIEAGTSYNDFVNVSGENLVVRQQNNITFVTNAVNFSNGTLEAGALLNNAGHSEQDISIMALSVPTTKLRPTVYINENYCDFYVLFNVNLTSEIIMLPASKFADEPNSIQPEFYFYCGTTQYDYEIKKCPVTINYIKRFNDKAISIDYTIKVKFDEPTYILGFWTGVKYPNYLFTESVANATYFVNTYTLAPINFVSEEYGVVLYETQNQILQSSYSFYEKVDKPSLKTVYQNANLSAGTDFLAYHIDKMYNTIPFIRYAINASLALACISIVLGIAVPFGNFVIKQTKGKRGGK